MLSEQYPIFLDNVAGLCSAVPLKFRQTRRGDIMLVLHHNFNSCALALLSIKKGTCQICRKDSAVKMLLYHIAHSHRRHTDYVEFILTSQACRPWGCRVCHFGRSVNPISNKGGRLCPIILAPPDFQIFRRPCFITCSHVNFLTSNLVGP